jgi:uncharacterized membrane protein YeaQ/YmgE (transglycosylase-associated protein family)
MKLVGRVELKTMELPDALEFTIEREYGWFEIVLGLAITFLALWLFWRVHTAIAHLLVVAISGAVVVSVIAQRVQGRSTRLRVTSDGLYAVGNLDKLFTIKLRIPYSEIASFEYNFADEGASGGIYVKHRGSRTCVLPGLDEDQGVSVKNAIFEKFPDLVPEDTSPESLLYGNESELTTLGLSASDSKEDESKP